MGKGRPAHQPTDQTRKMVERGKMVGLNNEEIAAVLGISSDTLVKYYGIEIDQSKSKVVMQIGGKLIQKAINGDNTCMIFYLKTQAGWREKSELELTGKDGGPVFAVIEEYNPKK